MKNILLLVHDDAGQEARFQAALDICRSIGGHLTCLDVAIMPPIIATNYVDGAGVLLVEERTREAVNRAELEARLAHEDVSWDWVDATGTLAACLQNASNLADLIVVNRELDDFPLPDMRAVAGELIVHANRPILAVPDNLARFNQDRVMVGWDGSPAAAAALRAAVPLLARATTVVLVEIDDASVDAPAEDAAAYLSRHDIHATIRRIADDRTGAAGMVLKQASSGDFDYAVLGGFGHRRFMEALFGGVTRAMLTHSPIPVLMAH